MPKAGVTHYRHTIRVINPVCSEKMHISDILWSFDPNDTTCNNCQRTEQYKEDLEKKNLKKGKS